MIIRILENPGYSYQIYGQSDSFKPMFGSIFSKNNPYGDDTLVQLANLVRHLHDTDSIAEFLEAAEAFQVRRDDPHGDHWKNPDPRYGEKKKRKKT